MQLHYEAYGKNGADTTLVILHGLLGSGENWRTLSRKFADAGLRVLALDLRNHGRSPHAAPFTYEAMADDVRDTMDAAGVASAVVMGHSMGGKVAMRLALEQEARVDRLIVADMAPRPYAPHHTELLDALLGLDLDAVKARKDALEALAPAIPEAGVRQFLLKNLVRTDDGYRWQIPLDAIRAEYPNVIVEMTATGVFNNPTLFVRGGRSHYVRERDWPRIEALFPQARLVTIDNAGHWVHAEAPGPYFDAVMTFLSEE